MTAVGAVWRAPFGVGAPVTQTFDPRATLADMVAAMKFLPPDFPRRGDIVVGGHAVDRARWRSVRLKPGVRATFHHAPGGGGGSGEARKRGVIGLVIAIATVLTAGAVAAGGIPALGIAAGSTAAKVAAGGVSLIGSLAAQAISAPPARTPQHRDESPGPASISGNVLRPGGFLPRVIGTRRIFPPLAAQPLTMRDGDDEIVEAVFALAGPHNLEDIRVGDTPVDGIDDIEIETRIGWPGDGPLTSVRRIAHTAAPGAEIKGHEVTPDDGNVLADQTAPANSAPDWRRFATRGAPDQILLHLLLPEGLVEPSLPDRILEMPIRLRMRPIGASSWINLPELHLQSVNSRSLRPTVIITRSATAMPRPPQNQGWTAAFINVGSRWRAHTMFRQGFSGSDSYHHGSYTDAQTDVTRVSLTEHEATISLDPNQAPPGAYEIEIIRGAVFPSTLLDKDTYRYHNGISTDFFRWRTDGGRSLLWGDRHKQSDRLYMQRFISLFNRHPIYPWPIAGTGRSGSGLALIAVRAKNRDLSQLSVEASGLVRDWTGSSWGRYIATSLPAPHFRDVLAGTHGDEPLPADLLDNRSLVDWRNVNRRAGHRCDLIAEGARIPELLTRIAGCGYARPAQAEVWGVIRDYDRSGEDPTQIFSAANSSGLAMARGFARLPDALRCAFRDGDDSDRDREILVWREGRSNVAAPKIEDVRYEGLRYEADVRRRARHDLRQAALRAAIFTFRAPAEAIRCRRGDLIGVNHEGIDRRHGSARIEDVEYLGSRVYAIVVDADLELWNEPCFLASFPLTSTGFFALGRKSAIEIRGANGRFSVHNVSGVSGTRRRIRLQSLASSSAAAPGNLVIAGERGLVKKRLIVAGVEFDRELTATISAVPEAPEIFAGT